MARANAAYYATHDPFADFTTSPEISQVFGEILGLWAAVDLGTARPARPGAAGRGRARPRHADGGRAAGGRARGARLSARRCALHLIETSPRLRAIQAERLPDATWHDGLATLPRRAADAAGQRVPRRAADPPVRAARGRMDGAVRRGWAVRGACAAGPTRPSPAQARQTRRCTASTERPLSRSRGGGLGWGPGDRHRNRRTRPHFARTVAARLATHGGAALFLDYGPEHSGPGDSLQALRDGRPADPLSPTRAPPTSPRMSTSPPSPRPHARPARQCTARCPQGIFLARLGLFQRTDRLARGQPPARAAALIEAARRLAEPDRMGRLFKALAVCHPACPTPPDSRPIAMTARRRATPLRRVCQRRTASSPASAASPAGPTPASTAACPAAIQPTRSCATAPAPPAPSARSPTGWSA